MKKSKAIRRLKEIRRDAEECLRDSIESNIEEQDIEALTAGIEALSARDPDRTGRLRRDSKMLELILSAVAATAYESERSMLDAIMAYWRRGKRAESPIERAALDEYRKECRWHVRPDNLDGRREIICRVALLMLEDVYPETKKEVTTNDQQR
jgi:hypothetical protein|nr:MAG TPA: hypothetical protein [Caudoviricetes sp.]